MRKKLFFNYILLLAVGLLIFTLSEYIQWYGDSYAYRFRFDNGESVENITGLIQSQYAHYLYMNGRIWAHSLCQAFSAFWGQTSFAACNAAMYIMFVLLFVRIVGMSWKRISDLLICSLTILFFCDVSYNTNCQIGYIWTSTVTLAFIILYKKYKATRQIANLSLLSLLFLLSLLAGNGNEAIAIGVGASLVFNVFFNFRKLTMTQWIMFIGFSIGGLFLCLSPGILNRASEDSPNVVWSAYRLIIYSRMLYAMIIILVILKLRKRINFRKFALENSFFFIALTMLLIFNFIIGIGLSNRQLFGVELFAGIVTMRAIKGIALSKWIIILFSVLVIIMYALKFDYLKKSNEDLRNLRNEIVQSKDMKIYVDFHHYSKLVHPTEIDNSYKIYAYASYSLIDHLADFGQIYLNKQGITPSYFEKLVVYPTVMKNVLESEDRNFAVKCNDGMYLVVQDKNNPKRFFLERNYSIFGLKWTKKPYEIEFGNRNFQNMGDLNIVYSDFDTPFVENGEIIMK